jgi:hypothetical protein
LHMQEAMVVQVVVDIGDQDREGNAAP